MSLVDKGINFIRENLFRHNSIMLVVSLVESFAVMHDKFVVCQKFHYLLPVGLLIGI